MNRETVLTTLRTHLPVLRQRYGVTRLALFGSVGRNTATPTSDIDLLVAFAGAATSAQYFGVLFYLEDLLGCTVDLVTDKALRPVLRPTIEHEAIDV